MELLKDGLKAQWPLSGMLESPVRIWRRELARPQQKSKKHTNKNITRSRNLAEIFTLYILCISLKLPCTRCRAAGHDARLHLQQKDNQPALQPNRSKGSGFQSHTGFVHLAFVLHAPVPDPKIETASTGTGNTNWNSCKPCDLRCHCRQT